MIDATTGALSTVPGSPYAGVSASGLTVDPSGRFLYVVSGSIAGYTISTTDGSLTPMSGSPFSAGITLPIQLAADSSGQFLYGAGLLGVTAFKIDQSTGVPTTSSTATFAGGASATIPETLIVVKIQ